LDTAFAPTAVVPNGTTLLGAYGAAEPATPGDAPHGSHEASANTTAVAPRQRHVSITHAKVTLSGADCHPEHSLTASISIRKRA
jgi:hypothetical protein